MKENKPKSTVVASYLVSEGGAKYLKFGPKRDKSKEVVGKNPFPLTINEGDVLFVNIFDEDFREQYNIPDFVKGTVQMPNEQTTAAPSKAKPKEDDTF